MAQITEVKVNYGKTINLGNYESAVKVNYGKTINLGNNESARVDVELTAKILPGESSEEAVEDLRAMAKLKVKQWESIERKSKSAKDYF